MRKREFPSTRLEPYRHRRARGERSAQEFVGVCPCRSAVAAGNRELRCASTAVQHVGAVKVAGHHSLRPKRAINDRICHDGFLSKLKAHSAGFSETGLLDRMSSLPLREIIPAWA